MIARVLAFSVRRRWYVLLFAIAAAMAGVWAACLGLGMDRVTRFNVLAMSGRAVEAAGVPRGTSSITAEPAALSVAPVPLSQESKCAPSITTSSALSVPGICLKSGVPA